MRYAICLPLLFLFQTGGYCQSIDPTHHVPADKRVPESWAASMFDTKRTVYTGDALTTIGMPCGGIASGQLYVRGDGTLAGWWIANDAYNTGYGAAKTNNFTTALGPWKVCYQTFRPFSYIAQGFTMAVDNGAARPLDRQGYHAIEFTGEYPVATIAYKDRQQAGPVSARLQVYSPFIPLDARASATPATVLEFTLTNEERTTHTVTLAGFLQNMVGLDGKGQFTGASRNRVVSEPGMTGVTMDLVKANLPETHPWNGNMTLDVLSDNAFARADSSSRVTTAERPLGDPLIGMVGATFQLRPGESKKVTFLVTWYFPHRPIYTDVDWGTPLSTVGTEIGNNYRNWYTSAWNVAQHLEKHLDGLRAKTFAFHDDYYLQSTLPYWLNRRLMMPLSTLATETCQWWGDGKFWAWEGVGSCPGTCTHVWNYEQGMAHFFPELERNVRERTDFANSFRPDGGIYTRNGTGEVMIDGQCGTILKSYRENLLSPDNAFLARNWNMIKTAMHYLIRADSDANGLIEGVQPNTYDIEFYGANTYVGGLYLAALRACAQMADVMKDPFADSCRILAERGSKNSVDRLFNGEYFFQDVDLKAHPTSQYGKGCLADQVFGQTWADLYGLGYIYPAPNVRSALQAVYTYNWAPDVAAQNKYHPAERDYADPGEAGLLVCTWPHDPHPGDSGVRYRDEVWTGIEYQVATSMIAEGMLPQALNILRGLDSRYDGVHHNPWNEIECGDHYARALASWGVMLALEGFQYDGPAGFMAIDPQITPGHFRSFFTAAEGWGTISQERFDRGQINTVHVTYGRLSLSSIQLTATGDAVTVTCAGRRLPVKAERRDGNKLLLHLSQTVTLQPGATLIITIPHNPKDS